jgi:Putative prokaryotic signal transducing protein
MPDLVKVLSVPSLMEGEIVKARLEGEGIPVLLKGGGSDPLGGVAYVFVPSAFEAQARLVLQDVGDETSG